MKQKEKRLIQTKYGERLSAEEDCGLKNGSAGSQGNGKGSFIAALQFWPYPPPMATTLLERSFATPPELSMESLLVGEGQGFTIFKLTSAGKETTLYNILGGNYPLQSMSRDSAGNLYGVSRLAGLGF